MAETHTISNTWMTYIGNSPYVYPRDNISVISPNGLNTGWHVVPNMLWKHFVSPKQWAEMVIKYEAYHVEGIKVKVFNMIPMTQQLAIQGNTVFTAFNNCIYALAYKDDLYETSWYDWYTEHERNNGLNLIYKEGLYCPAGTDNNKRWMLPVYTWHPPNQRVRSSHSYSNWDFGGDHQADGVYPGGSGTASQTYGYKDKPSGVVWDPMNRPSHLMELRPGKNTIGWSWECHPSDANKWFNFDQLAWWHPYVPEGPYDAYHQRPGTYKLSGACDPDRVASRWESTPAVNDYTIPNYENIPVVPMMWWWKEIQESICPYNDTQRGFLARRINQFFVGTEYECYHYGPTQFFIKLIPLFDSNGTHISCTANVSVQTELILKCKPRRSAIYAPTWGPWGWLDLYTAQTHHRRFAPSMVRSRTGGARRTWQNEGDNVTDNMGHPRETPFIYTETVASGTGMDNTYRMTQAPSVTYSKKTDTVTVWTTTSRKRGVTPSAPPMEEDSETQPPTRDPLYPPLDAFQVHKV